MSSLRENYEEFIKNNNLTLKSQQRFGSKKHVFTEEVKKIKLSANNGNKRIQLIDSIET